jgi:5-methylcytosine-specific restriction endonuclease McrA
LFQVAGSNAPPCGPEKALRRAHETHGGPCFYCKSDIAPGKATIDHVEALADGGATHLQNLVLACQPCNQRKGRTPIEFFKPDAGKEWLTAVLAQVQARLDRF